MAVDALPIHRARLDVIGPHDLYGILQLRSAVFVVEQDCAFLDLDGRDVEPATEQLWIRDDVGIVSSLRILDEGDGVWSIGRVVTRPDARSAGAAARLLQEALTVLDGRGADRVVLGGQAHLQHFYERFGFTVSGPGYDEDGIPHVPMTWTGRRDAPTDGRTGS